MFPLPIPKITLMFALILITVLPLSAKEKCTVIRVIDGDTLKVECRGVKETVRLIGIDTPESKGNRKAKRDAKKTGIPLNQIIKQGKKATAFVKTIVNKGTPVIIEYDVQKRDRYKRVLAYLYLPSGEMLNEKLIRVGFATIMRVPPNTRNHERFLELFVQR